MTLWAIHVYPELCTLKYVMKEMSKNPCLRGPFNKQCGKGTKHC